MHLIFGIRGHKEYQDKFINELSTRYLPYKKYNPQSKNLQDWMLQVRVCPIQLFDVSFPKQHYDVVANTILGASLKGKPMNPKHEKFIWVLRKMMGVDKIPEFKQDAWLSMGLPEHQEIIVIGVKEDKWITEDGKMVDEKDKTPLSYEGI